jgi:hypothetical protein
VFEYDGLEDVLAFGFDDIDGEAGGVLNDEDLGLVAETLEPDSSAALIVWEHRWAAASWPASGAPSRSSRAPWPGPRRPPADRERHRGKRSGRCGDAGSGGPAVRG